MKSIIQSLFAALFVAVTFTQCIDQDFDTPDLTGETPNIAAENILTIKSIVDQLNLNQPTALESGKYIKGIVVADDKSGNFYKNLIIQDETAGIAIVIDETDLFNTYFVGTEVFLKLDDIYLGNYRNLPQLGMAPNADGDLSRIPSALLEEYLLPGTIANAVAPKTILLGEISDAYLNQLVHFAEVEFANADLGGTYAIGGSNPSSKNVTVVNCDNTELVMRSSGYSSFAGTEIASGNGNLYGILQKFGETFQLVIRDLGDVQLDGERCNGSGGTGGTGDGITNIEGLLNLWNAGTAEIPSGSTFTGVVISDAQGQNINNQNLQIQDGEYGITLRFSEPHSFALGESLTVDVGAREISEFNGQVQISDLFLDRVTSNGAGTMPTPRKVTIADILTNHDKWESTLVEVDGVTISGGSTMVDAKTLTDATGEIATFVRNGSTFAGDAVPSGPVTITAIIGEFNDPQLLFRNSDDF